MALGIALAMPASWRSLDVDPATVDESHRRVVEEAIPSGPGAAQARELMLRTLRQAMEGGAGRGAVLAAMYSSTAEGVPLGASLVASVIEATPGPNGEPPPDGRALAASLRSTVAGGSGEGWDLPAGPGVRVQRQQTAGDIGATVRVETVQWFVLHPSGERMAILSFSTPNLALAEPFGEVFDAIAWSLQWTS